MPDYITRAALSAIVPPQFILEALDDNKDGIEDPGLYQDLLTVAQKEVDGILGKRFRVPFANPIPDIVSTATLKIMGELLYKRRGYSGEQNPHEAAANKERAALEKIASGTDPLTPEVQRKNPSASIVTEKAKTTSRSGRTAV
ncbi:phage protein Gp36 family protein [Geminisphaera colitermitum]|uniref:phage protein Gp36 family protein n=1 Tax=Geminisphaera colitermitum TaxID=1148786 RepID=UPI000158CBAB|nr:phage protein Gp36 family protein [Geminisphaera colitermitum]